MKKETHIQTSAREKHPRSKLTVYTPLKKSTKGEVHYILCKNITNDSVNDFGKPFKFFNSKLEQF